MSLHYSYWQERLKQNTQQAKIILDAGKSHLGKSTPKVNSWGSVLGKILNFSLFFFLKVEFITSYWASLVAQLVKNPPAMQETWVRSLDWEDALEKGMATHSSILAWRIPWIV